jgi:hypothetical protein
LKESLSLYFTLYVHLQQQKKRTTTIQIDRERETLLNIYLSTTKNWYQINGHVPLLTKQTASNLL